MDEQSTPKKRCTGPCGQEYPATAEYWSPNKQGKYGLQSRCRACKKEYENRPESKERRRAYIKDYYSRPDKREHRIAYVKDYSSQPEKKELIRARAKAYNARPEIKARNSANQKARLNTPEGREQRKAYYNRPEVQEHVQSQRKRYNQRPEVQKRQRAYYEGYYSRPEIRKRILAQVKEYTNRPEIQERKINYEQRPEVKESARLRSHRRRAQKKSIAGTYSPEQIQDQLKRQKHKCYYCQKKLQKQKGRYIYHIEHTFPLSRVAGTDIPANGIDYLVLACPTCNLSKGDKFPWEWPEGGRLL